MNELTKRILTSIILFPLIIYCVYRSEIYILIILILFYSLSFFEILKHSKNIKFNIFCNIILLLSFYSFYSLRGDNDSSFIFLVWILLTTFLSDIGGFTVGKIIKGKKLTKISPNKTYSGSIGSFIFSLSSLPILNYVQQEIFYIIFINFLNFKFIFLNLTISFVCQAGDLFISNLKRKINIKDISNFLPGHGGVLDRIDGLIFVLLYINLLKIVNIV
jgi:phosphatidate cytidylyltransferase